MMCSRHDLHVISRYLKIHKDRAKRKREEREKQTECRKEKRAGGGGGPNLDPIPPQLLRSRPDPS